MRSEPRPSPGAVARGLASRAKRGERPQTWPRQSGLEESVTARGRFARPYPLSRQPLAGIGDRERESGPSRDIPCILAARRASRGSPSPPAPGLESGNRSLVSALAALRAARLSPPATALCPHRRASRGSPTPAPTLHRDSRQRSEPVALVGPGLGRRGVAGVLKGRRMWSGGRERRQRQPHTRPSSPGRVGGGHGEKGTAVDSLRVGPGGHAGGTPISDSRSVAHQPDSEPQMPSRSGDGLPHLGPQALDCLGNVSVPQVQIQKGEASDSM